MLLSDAINALLTATKADGRSTETVVAYRRKLKPLVAFLGDVPVEEVAIQEIRRYIASQFDQATLYVDHPSRKSRPGKLSIATVASRVRSLKRLFNWLEDEGVIEMNPTRRIKTPRPQQLEPKAVAMSDFLALLDATKGDTVADLRDRAILLFLADTGCRVGGLCNLRVRDVNLEAGLATVTEKGHKSRLVPFGPQTSDALRDWLAVRPAVQGDWLFVSLGVNAQGQLSTGGVAQMLKRRARQAGVTGRVNCHAFRHFFAREFLMNGGDLATLADLMGHSSILVTKASYAIFTVQELQKKHRQYSPVARLGGDGDDGRAGDS